MLAKISFLSLLSMYLPLAAETASVREMFTDRPDVTESAYSVAPGMFQLEMSFFDSEKDYSNSGRLDSWVYGHINFKYGLAQNTDLQIVFDTQTVLQSEGMDKNNFLSGFGDITLRLKQNLWGNDQGKTALSIMPFVSIPTGTETSADAWAGGVVVPFAAAINDRLSLGLMGQVDCVNDVETSGHDLEFLASAALGISLSDRWGCYMEIITSLGQDSLTQLRTAGGFTFAVTDNLVLDAGARFGLNRAAPDLGIFTGMSFRF